MKKFIFLLLVIFIGRSLLAQNIQASGHCITGTVILVKQATMNNGKPWYTAKGTVDGYADTDISIFWNSTLNTWYFAYDGQPFLKCTENTTKPPATTDFTWAVVDPNNPACANPTPFNITGDVSLGVTFGNIAAQLQDETLVISWETLKEVNNNRFEIEASADGKLFEKIATIQSKSQNGNSDSTLSYQWSSKTDLLMGSLSLVALVLLTLASLKRNRIVIACMTVAMIAVVGISCNKGNAEISFNDKFIRIAQIDKDGTTSYSEAVKIFVR